jgi:hypothetical protein
MDDHLHWFPKIQFSGTGLTLVSSLAPTLGFEIPYALRVGGVALGALMIAWPLFAYLGQLLQSARSILPKTFVGLGIGAALLGWNYWYFSNYSKNGGIWHIKLGITPPPPPPHAPPVQQPPPTPKPPWATNEEIEQQRKAGRTLLIYSPVELLQMSAGGQSTDVFLQKWIKVDYPVDGIPEPKTYEKKDYYIETIDVGGISFQALGSVVVLFDSKKWGDQLLMLPKGHELKATCQFEGIIPGKPVGPYDIRRDTLVAYNCDLL